MFGLLRGHTENLVPNDVAGIHRVALATLVAYGAWIHPTWLLGHQLGLGSKVAVGECAFPSRVGRRRIETMHRTQQEGPMGYSRALLV